jgi:HEAT repeat protein
LARLRAPGALAVVAESLAAADAEVRTSAAEALAHCADASVLPQLEAMLDDATLDARIRAADALLAVLARGR